MNKKFTPVNGALVPLFEPFEEVEK